MTFDATKTIGSIVKDCIPEEFQELFTEGGTDWLEWELGDCDDEDSIGTHVWNLLPVANEMLDWMPDASDDFIASYWRAVANQCLTWVRG